MQAIVDTIVALGAYVLNLFKALVTAVWDIFTDAVAYVFDKLLSFAVSALSALDVTGISGINAWGSLPADVSNILGLIGLGQCMGIIAAAIGIRLVMQLIPFVRLGS